MVSGTYTKPQLHTELAVLWNVRSCVSRKTIALILTSVLVNVKHCLWLPLVELVHLGGSMDTTLQVSIKTTQRHSPRKVKAAFGKIYCPSKTMLVVGVR